MHRNCRQSLCISLMIPIQKLWKYFSFISFFDSYSIAHWIHVPLDFGISVCNYVFDNEEVKSDANKKKIVWISSVCVCVHVKRRWIPNRWVCRKTSCFQIRSKAQLYFSKEKKHGARQVVSTIHFAHNTNKREGNTIENINSKIPAALCWYKIREDHIDLLFVHSSVWKALKTSGTLTVEKWNRNKDAT